MLFITLRDIYVQVLAYIVIVLCDLFFFFLSCRSLYIFKVQFIIFSFMVSDFCVWKIFACPKLGRYAFLLLVFIFGPVTHLKWFLMHEVSYYFLYTYLVVPASFIEKTFFSPLNYLALYQKSIESKKCESIFKLSILFSGSIYLFSCQCLDYHSFIISLEIW